MTHKRVVIIKRAEKDKNENKYALSEKSSKHCIL